MINLGDKVKEKITGFEGIVTAKTEWINGCVRLSVQSPKLKDGKPLEVQWFDEGDLELKSKKKAEKKRHTGGDRNVPTRQSDPNL